MDSFIYPGKIFHEGRGRFQLPGNVVEIEHDVQYLRHIVLQLFSVLLQIGGMCLEPVHDAGQDADMGIV